MHGNDGIGSKIGLGVGRLPLAQVHRKGDDSVLYATDAGREGLVVGVDRELVLLCVEVLLDAIGILRSPFVGLAVVNEVVVFEARRAGGVPVGSVDFGMPLVRDCHEFIGDTEVQVALVKVAIEVVGCVVPGAVDLVPFSVELDGIPGVTVIDIAGL